MFAYITGKIEEVEDNRVLIKNDFFGIEVLVVFVPKMHENISLYLHSILSNEGIYMFYGFNTKKELKIFQELIKIQGLGGRMAIKLLNNLGISSIATAIYNKDNKTFENISGIGKKLAMRIINDLQDKVIDFMSTTSFHNEIINILISVGYKLKEIFSVINHCDSNMSIEENLKICMGKMRQNNDKK
ncbi:hypothetical protein AB836_01145 [Rickettsiales bacterium (ex Bugula neritina AB1)]|nr:hypothetical protein AB836_01145 [Rickettsiales bacterium (ex Bugula neritina AB1)]